VRCARRPPVTRYLVAHLSGDYCFSIARARRELGYEPAVGLDQALVRTAAWYRKVVRGERPDG
jgi:nucleoside-diphosphate-sugar epimerase